jgi:hypothetical protein
MVQVRTARGHPESLRARPCGRRGVAPGISVTPRGDTPDMATQLRLVDPPPASEPTPRAPSRTAAPSRRQARATTRKPGRKTTATVGSARRPARGRRAVSWGEWELDARTRSIGRAGVAAARDALERAAVADQLPRAS